MKIAFGRCQAPAIVVMSIVLSAWLIGPQVISASWGIIDDHDTLKMPVTIIFRSTNISMSCSRRPRWG
jgi:hypothetical protein